MNYRFKCRECGAEEERNIPLAFYDEQKEKQVCACGAKMKRVIEWQGYAKSSGDGWCGKSSGNAI